ncbi:unnamed protein product [Mytilus edulis]|uniref:CCHC-type domain-containing protein n=1 Tax=Mytilus edulis TaxID=6550 RepID=A0A8S3SZB0_MYTED|nr:unnamed protein product [Mytilus edulis]
MKTRTSNIEFSKTKDKQAQLPIATIFDVRLILQKQITTDGNNITGSCTSEDGDVLINYHSFKGPNFGFDIALIDETTVAFSSGASMNKIGQNTDGQKLVCNKCLQTGHKLMQCPNDWVCRQCKKPGHKQADCTDDLSSNHEDATNEQSDANDADTEDNEAPQSQSILQPLTSMASFSINLDQGNKSPAKKSGDNVKDLPDPVGDRSRNRRGRNNKNKKNDKPEGNIEQYFNGQASENTDTPKVKNTGKRNATTPTEDKHKEAGLIQKTKT